MSLSDPRRRRFLAGLAAFAGSGTARPALGAATRIVAIDWGLAATLVSLGVTPVGVAEIPLYRTWVAEPALPAAVADVGLRTAPNLERLAALRPDLIVMGQQTENARALMAPIAPALVLDIYSGQRTPLAAAGEAALSLGAATGREAEARAFITAFERTAATARARLAGIDRAVLPIAFLDERHVRVYGRGSLPADVLARLGLRSAYEGATNPWGFAVLGLADLSRHSDAIAVVIGPTPPGVEATLARPGLWRALPFVREGRVRSIGPVWAFGDLSAAARFAQALPPALTGSAP